MVKYHGGKITRILKKRLPNGFRGVYKINIVGSTGAGKTEFLKHLLKGLFQPTTEVKRRVDTEKIVDATYNWFRIGTGSESSTTTVSLNSVGILLLKTQYNSIEFHPVHEWEKLLMRDDVEEIWKFNFFDSAGQERFDFMPEITMRGADAVIILADGTNMSSIEKISQYLDLVDKEEDRTGKVSGIIPVIIMLNKADLISKGVYIGLDTVKRFISSGRYEFLETSMKTGLGVDDSIRILLSKFEN